MMATKEPPTTHEPRTYYIQDTRTICGNCAMWWGKDSSGYTCNLDEAGVYDEEEARRIEKIRGTDRLVPVEIARAIAVRHVRADGALQAALEAAGIDVQLAPTMPAMPQGQGHRLRSGKSRRR